jgi:hypothetical protein
MHEVRYTGRRVIPIRFIKRDFLAPHRDGFRGSCLSRICYPEKPKSGVSVLLDNTA